MIWRMTKDNKSKKEIAKYICKKILDNKEFLVQLMQLILLILEIKS